MQPDIEDLLRTARVVAIPLATRFRGIDVREALVMRGPSGWTEFSPFIEYDDAESAAWLRAAIDFGWSDTPTLHRDHIRVNATVPAVDAAEIPSVLARFPGCRTAKVKVAERSQVLADDIARVSAVRDALGPEGRIRVDANAGWNVDQAERAIHALATFDLEYVEQPCASVEELAEIRARVADFDVPIAADESVRKASDPLAVARAGAADIIIVKAQPLGGIHAALRIAGEVGLPVVVSSALDTSVGISMGAHLAAALPQLDFDCGLATTALLSGDVTRSPLDPVDGAIRVERVDVDTDLLDRFEASPERRTWWLNRLRHTHELLG